MSNGLKKILGESNKPTKCPKCKTAKHVWLSYDIFLRKKKYTCNKCGKVWSKEE